MHPDVRRARLAEAQAIMPLGTRVRKRSGSSWSGLVVGYYSTDLTPHGVAVESSSEVGSVQIYPTKALELQEDPSVAR